MTDWMVPCPECGTRFRVSAAQLSAADGMVRCGACLAVFRASDRLEPLGAEKLAADEPSAPVGPPHRHRSVLAAASRQNTGEHLAGGLPRGALDAVTVRGELPTLERASVRKARRWPWILLSGLALLLLLVQGIVWTFDEAIRDPRLRPAYAAVCGYIGCELPELRDVSAIHGRRLDVRPHPQRADGLVLEATIENRAPFEQPFPELLLEFSDVRGRLLAARSFEPEEYLAGEIAPGDPMPSRREIRIALELENPGRDAVNYRMRFR